MNGMIDNMRIINMGNASKYRFLRILAVMAHHCLNIMTPNICPVCRHPTADMKGLCTDCWQQLTWIEYPYCDRLGIPFSYDLGPQALSAQAIANPPPFAKMRAVVVYGAIATNLVQSLKYRDRLDIAPMIAHWMARAGRDVTRDCDCIIPVPLHWSRLWRRRFNQAAVLARSIAQITNKPYRPDIIVRTRNTRQQVGLSARERENNVRGAFRILPNQKQDLNGQRVLLVDDVYTTGATTHTITRTLLRNGAKQVNVLIFACVVSDFDQTI